MYTDKIPIFCKCFAQLSMEASIMDIHTVYTLLDIILIHECDAWQKSIQTL